MMGLLVVLHMLVCSSSNSSFRFRPILVSGIGRCLPVSVSADTYFSIGADTSSPVIHLPVSTPFHAHL